MQTTTFSHKDRVLIVDDTRSIVSLLSSILAEERFDVYTAHSGEEALELLEHTFVDTILMDVNMGKGLDGYETCKRIKAQPDICDIPVIFLSAAEDAESKIKGFEAGGVDFISKSADKLEILVRVRSKTRLFKLQDGMRKGFAYIKAILDAQKNMIAIFDESYELETYNVSYAKHFPTSHASLISRLRTYDGYQLPKNDDEFFRILTHSSDFKASLAASEAVYSFELSIVDIDGSRKYILTVTDITIFEVARKQETQLLTFQQRYHHTQQQNAFKKQKKIIQDTVSHLNQNGWYFDSYYKPLDILSGDTYGSYKLYEGGYFFYLIDAMGKGLSASVTSIQSSSFINNAIDRALAGGDFIFEGLVQSFCAFIKKQLLDDEILCAVFVELDINAETIKVANFAMPPIVIEKHGIVEQIGANNTPIMSFLSSSNVSTIDIHDVTKLLLYSDGFNESGTKNEKPYATLLPRDFQQASTLQDIIHSFLHSVEKINDDVTLLYLTKPNYTTLFRKSFRIASDMSHVIEANKEMETIILECDMNEKNGYDILFIFNELLMNAFEHGSLHVDYYRKKELIQSGEYEEFLANQAPKRTRHITIDVELLQTSENVLFLKVCIEDEGDGFAFSDILKLEDPIGGNSYSGRGVWMAKNASDGIFFNEKGNKTIFFKKCTPNTSK